MLQQIRNFIQNRPKVVYVILDIPMFVVTFAFIVLTGHALEPEPLALFNSGLGIFTVLSTIGLAVQSVIARRIAAAKKIVGVRDFFLGTIIVGLLTIIPFLLPLPEMKSLDAAGISTMVLYLSAHMGISFCRGILQGTERFYALWSAQALEHLVRIGLLIALMQGVVSIGAVWVVVVSAAFAHVVYGAWLLPKSIWKDIWYQSSPQKDLTKEIFAVVMCNFFLNYLLSVDIIIGGEKLGDAGGAYVTANKFGKLLYFVGASIAIVVLPWFSRRSMTQDTKKQLFVGMLIFIPATMVLSPLSAIILDPFIRFMFPLDIVPTFALLSWTLMANFALCAIQLFVTWHIAQQTRGLNWVLGICCAVFTPLFVFFGQDDMGIIYVTNAMVWVATFFLAALALRQQTIESVSDSDTDTTTSEIHDDSTHMNKEDQI